METIQLDSLASQWIVLFDFTCSYEYLLCERENKKLFPLNSLTSMDVLFDFTHKFE